MPAAATGRASPVLGSSGWSLAVCSVSHASHAHPHAIVLYTPYQTHAFTAARSHTQSELPGQSGVWVSAPGAWLGPSQCLDCSAFGVVGTTAHIGRQSSGCLSACCCAPWGLRKEGALRPHALSALLVACFSAVSFFFAMCVPGFERAPTACRACITTPCKEAGRHTPCVLGRLQVCFRCFWMVVRLKCMWLVQCQRLGKRHTVHLCPKHSPAIAFANGFHAHTCVSL